jgi:hypothetical protein
MRASILALIVVFGMALAGFQDVQAKRYAPPRWCCVEKVCRLCPTPYWPYP